MIPYSILLHYLPAKQLRRIFCEHVPRLRKCVKMFIMNEGKLLFHCDFNQIVDNTDYGHMLC